MDSLVVLLINVGVGIVAGIATGYKNYKDKKKRKKLEKQVKEQQNMMNDIIEKIAPTNEPIETPSEAGYVHPASYHDTVE